MLSRPIRDGADTDACANRRDPEPIMARVSTESTRRKGIRAVVAGAAILAAYFAWSYWIRRRGLITPFLPVVAGPGVLLLYFGFRALAGGTGETRAMKRVDARASSAIEGELGVRPDAVGWFELDLDYVPARLRKQAEQLPLRVERSRPRRRTAILALVGEELVLFGAQLAAFTGAAQMWELGRWPTGSVRLERIGHRGMNQRIALHLPGGVMTLESFDYLGTSSTADLLGLLTER